MKQIIFLSIVTILLSACSAAPVSPTIAETQLDSIQDQTLATQTKTEATNPTLAPTTSQTQPPTTIPITPSTIPPTVESAETIVSFANDIMPIIQSNCISCHGGDRTSEGLNMSTYSKLMTGSSNGPVIVPRDAMSSLFVTLAQQGKMPKRGAKLTAEQIEVFMNWVNQGAVEN